MTPHFTSCCDVAMLRCCDVAEYSGNSTPRKFTPQLGKFYYPTMRQDFSPVHLLFSPIGIHKTQHENGALKPPNTATTQHRNIATLRFLILRMAVADDVATRASSAVMMVFSLFMVCYFESTSSKTVSMLSRLWRPMLLNVCCPFLS